MNVNDELWMLLHWKYGMVIIVQKLYSIRTDNCSYLDVTNDITLNCWNNGCEWWSMTVSALKILNESNCTEICIKLKQATALTLLFPPMFDWINKTMNVSDEVWRWVYQNYGMSQIIQKHYKKLQGLLMFQSILASKANTLIQDLTTD